MAERKQGDQDTGVRSAVITQTKPKTQKPSMYRVLILNDDYTPMEFVVYVLEQYFNKSREDATRRRRTPDAKPPESSGPATKRSRSRHKQRRPVASPLPRAARDFARPPFRPRCFREFSA